MPASTAAPGTVRGADRPMQPLERQFWLAGRLRSANVVTAASVRGPLGEAALRGALDAAQARHPLLGVRVVGVPGALRFVPTDEPLPLRVAPGPPEAWLGEAEHELAAAWPERGPLLRATLVGRGEEHALLLTFHHSIGDAMAGFHLSRELLVHAGGAPGALPARHTEDPPIVEALPWWARSGAGRGWRTLRILPVLLRVKLRPGPVLASDGQAPLDQRRSRLLLRSLDEAGTAALVAHCRAEQTSVEGALGAAAMLALRDELPEEGALLLACSHAVSLRPLLHRAPGGSFGLSAVASGTVHGVPRGQDFWALARDVRAQLARAIARGDPLRAALPQGIARYERMSDAALAEVVVSRRSKLRLTGAGVTNLGRLDAPAAFGPLRWEGFTFAPAVSVGSSAGLACATTFRGRLAFTFVHPLPAVSPARGARLADAILRRLTEAASGPPRRGQEESPAAPAGIGPGSTR